MVIMARTGVEDMYLVLLLMARVLRRVRIKRRKGRRKADGLKMVRMVRSMGTEAKARRTTVKGRPDKKDKVTKGSDSHNPTT
jgi:hypothetical protein